MNSAKIIELLAYTLPSVITGGVAYYLFALYFKDQQNTRRWLMQKEYGKDMLPLRLQAYERMTLLMERINPANLLVRITPISEDKHDYARYVIAQIEQEFEHNLAQQIYITDECWSLITTAKNATIQMIRISSMNEDVSSADSLREYILTSFVEKQSPSYAALAFLKNEIGQLW
jgi:hypothetical protein